MTKSVSYNFSSIYLGVSADSLNSPDLSQLPHAETSPRNDCLGHYAPTTEFNLFFGPPPPPPTVPPPHLSEILGGLELPALAFKTPFQNYQCVNNFHNTQLEQIPDEYIFDTLLSVDLFSNCISTIATGVLIC